MERKAAQQSRRKDTLQRGISENWMGVKSFRAAPSFLKSRRLRLAIKEKELVSETRSAEGGKGHAVTKN